MKGPKFFAHDVGKGGGGAIDLVMLVEGTDYRGAVQWLSGQFGKGPVLQEAVATAKREIDAAADAPKRPYKTPEAVPERWPRVRHYLTEIRRLSGSLVDELHERGKIYADRYANAVFVLTKGRGVELRGTGEQPFHGVRGEKAPFVIGTKGEEKVAFVESAIDAMSLSDLGFKGEIISTSGFSAKIAKAMAQEFREHGWKVVAAFDNDRAGEQMVANLGYPCERLRPKHGKDWNDELRLKRTTPAERMAMEQKELQRNRDEPEIEL